MPQSILEAREISKISENASLSDISFIADTPGVYGIFGLPGSGKSLLCRLLASACRPDKGELLFRGSRMYLSDRCDARLKRKIGYVSKDGDIVEGMTVAETAEFVGQMKVKDLDKLARQMKEAFSLMELEGKSNVLTEELSYAERKRLAIACAILGNPDIVIFEEPFKNADNDQRDVIKNIIEILRRKKIVFIFTDNPKDNELYDKIVIIKKGRIVLDTPLTVACEKLKKEKINLKELMLAFSEANIDEPQGEGEA